MDLFFPGKTIFPALSISWLPVVLYLQLRPPELSLSTVTCLRVLSLLRAFFCQSYGQDFMCVASLIFLGNNLTTNSLSSGSFSLSSPSSLMVPEHETQELSHRRISLYWALQLCIWTGCGFL